MKLASLKSFDKFLSKGPSFLCYLNPMLGPLYSEIEKKIIKGKMHLFSELHINAKEVLIENLNLKGSLIIEDNELAGGLGAEICQIVCENYPTKVKMLGCPKDRFTVIGPSPKALYDYLGINVEGVRKAAKEILS